MMFVEDNKNSLKFKQRAISLHALMFFDFRV